jgi:hypothetical protein
MDPLVACRETMCVSCGLTRSCVVGATEKPNRMSPRNGDYAVPGDTAMERRIL